MQQQVQTKNNQLLINVQTKLKEEYLSLTTQQQQKNSFQNKLTNQITNYYCKCIHLSKSDLERNNKKKIKQQPRLFEDEGLGDAYIFVKEVLLSLSKDPNLMVALIKKHSNWSSKQFGSIPKLIVGSLYQNIVDDNIYNKGILKILQSVINILIDSKQYCTDLNFNEDNFLCFILKQFLNKYSIKNYSKHIIRKTILQVSKIDHLIQYSSTEPQQNSTLSMTKIHTKKIDYKSNFNYSIEKSKIKIYSEALSQKDNQIKINSYNKIKNKYCMSKKMIEFMGIYEEIQLPSFISPNADKQAKKQEQLNKKFTTLLNNKLSKKQESGNEIADISIVRNIVLIFFSDVFKMLYSMPTSVRIICYMIYNTAINKFHNKKLCLEIISQFIIISWLMQAIVMDDNFVQNSKLGDHFKYNMKQIINIIKSIVNNNYDNINDHFVTQFNNLINHFRISIFNYVTEVINIQGQQINQNLQKMKPTTISDNVEQNQSQQHIRSHCVCLNIGQLKILLDMLHNAEKQLNNINQKIPKKMHRIVQMTQGENIFGPRTDKKINKVYSPQQSYILFTEIVLPQDLGIDYTKFYTDSFKNHKVKNLIRQVLLNIDVLEKYPNFITSRTFYEFLSEISLMQDSSLYSVDRIPIKVRIKYLLLVGKGIDLDKLIQQMDLQINSRMNFFKQKWDKSKYYYLTALANIIFQNQKLMTWEVIMQKELKKKSISELIAQTKVSICLTSPKTREKQLVLKTNIMKDLSQEQKQKIWLQNQSNCIHTTLNLQFITLLTGAPQTKTKKKYDCHFTSILKFTDIFCKLPEMHYQSINQEKLGIQEIFFQYIKHCKETIQNANNGMEDLGNGLEIEQNLQQKLGKRIYEKIYPKTMTYQDAAFYFRLKTLEWVTYEHLNISTILRVNSLWEIAIKALKLIDKVKTVGEKLDCIVESNRIIANSYQLLNDGNRPASADDLFPLIVYVLIKAAPRRMISNISFIELLANKQKLVLSQGYCYSQLKSAVQLCDNLTEENLNLCPSKVQSMVEFHKNIYEKQIKYGIYFLLHNPKESIHIADKKMSSLKQYLKTK